MPPVLLLHGGVANSNYWGFQIEELPKAFTVRSWTRGPAGGPVGSRHRQQLNGEFIAKFAGKIVIDPANAVARRDGEDLLKETKEKGIGATTQSYLKGSHVVRAFNSMSYTNFVKEAHRAGDPMAIPIAGDDARAVQVASQLVRDAGFEPVAVPLARAQEFAQGGPLYGQQLTGKALRERFGLVK